MSEITLRDEIAIAAMNGMLANPATFDEAAAAKAPTEDFVVHYAYIIADLMLKRRED